MTDQNEKRGDRRMMVTVRIPHSMYDLRNRAPVPAVGMVENRADVVVVA